MKLSVEESAATSEDQDDATSSEDDIVAMARNNLKRSQEFMVQATTIWYVL